MRNRPSRITSQDPAPQRKRARHHPTSFITQLHMYLIVFEFELRSVTVIVLRKRMEMGNEKVSWFPIESEIGNGPQSDFMSVPV